MWSLGALLFDIVTGEDILANKIPEFKTPVSEQCQDLIKWCLNGYIQPDHVASLYQESSMLGYSYDGHCIIYIYK